MTILKVCKHPGCRKLVESGYCDSHKKQPARYVKRKEKDRFLDSVKWRKMSKWKLETTPYCEDCREKGIYSPAQDVDHVLPRCDRPDLALSADNLRSLCDSCHCRKTNRDKIRN